MTIIFCNHTQTGGTAVHRLILRIEWDFYLSFCISFTLLRPIQRIDNTQHEVARKNVGVRFYTTYGIDA